MIDTRIQGQSIKKPSTKHSNNTNNKNGLSNHQSQSFYSNLSTVGTNAIQYQTRTNGQTTKHSPKPFLPAVSGASAFGHYPTNNGHSPAMMNKVKYNIINFISGSYELVVNLIES